MAKATLRLKGTKYYRAPDLYRLGQLRNGDLLRLVSERDNPHDKNAVAVFFGDAQLGHISRDSAPKYHFLLGDDGISSVQLVSAELSSGHEEIDIRISINSRDGDRVRLDYNFPDTPGIYEVHIRNGRCYIGSTVSLRKRHHQHLSDLKSRRHSNTIMQKDFNQYGEKSFTFNVLQYCRGEQTARDLEAQEIRKRIIRRDNLYNMTFDGQGRSDPKLNPFKSISDIYSESPSALQSSLHSEESPKEMASIHNGEEPTPSESQTQTSNLIGHREQNQGDGSGAKKSADGSDKDDDTVGSGMNQIPTQLLEALQHGTIDEIERLLQSATSIDLSDEEGWTLLHRATFFDRPEMVRYLLKRGATLTSRNFSGLTSLHMAHDHKCMKILLESGADHTARTLVGSTPLHHAALYGSLKTIDALLAFGADPFARCQVGIDAISMLEAGTEFDTQQADLELGYGDRQYQGGGGGSTPFHWAAAHYGVDPRANEAILNRIFEFGISLEDKDDGGNTPLHFAASMGQMEPLRWLIRKGADVGAINSVGATPLHLATYCGQLEPLRGLISKGADVGAIDSVGATPLHYAATFLHDSSVLYLLQSGAEILATDLDGKTPLHYAVKSMVEIWVTHEKYLGEWWLSIISCMIEYGGDVNFCDANGETPWSHLSQSEDAQNSEVYWLLNQSRF